MYYVLYIYMICYMYCVASSAARYELSPRSPIAAHPFAFATESTKQKRKQKQKHKTHKKQDFLKN